ncbi:SagB family peptide dehydrogenase [Metasolibacillus meyeri]|uniref:SagB family peptide dehydrogenase n=1 Tax=Metasolibacillus meyeri TaxID=1071052 RepID=UPI000D3203AC|nr:SagB family peptide dehydrogenase [Metasolibacillus meyeri]
MKKIQLDEDSTLAKQFHLNTKYYPGKIKKQPFPLYNHSFQKKQVYTNKIVDIPLLNERKDSLYQALMSRKSYTQLGIQIPISLDVVSVLLQLTYVGRNKNTNFITTVPSAGGIYSASIYLFAFNITGIDAGIYYWNPFEKHLALLRKGNFRKEFQTGIVDINKKDVSNCTFAIVLTTDINKICSKYEDRGYRLALLDIGYISQNLYLVSSHLDVAIRAIGGFYDDLISAMIPNNTDDVMLVHLFGKEVLSDEEQLGLNTEEYFH